MQYVALTDFQYPVIFSSEFSVLPRKISENLQTDSPSDANTRFMRTLHKSLNSNNLFLTSIFSSYNKHRFGLWYCPFQALKRTILHSDKGVIRAWNGLNRNVWWTVWACKAGAATWWYDRKEPLLCLLLYFLTSLSRFLFVKKKVKKICNFLIRVFFKTADIRSEEKYGKHETVLQELFIGRDNVNLLLREVHAVTLHTIQRHQKVLFFLFQVFYFCVFCRCCFGKLFLQYSCCLYVGFLISALS